jgi:VanZ family protein
MKRVQSWSIFLIYSALIFAASATPGHPTLDTQHDKALSILDYISNHFDKPIHGIIFAGLAGLMMRAWVAQGIKLSTAGLLTIFFCFLFGASDEWHQSFVPFREVSFGDWLADASGSLFMVILFAYKYSPKTKPRPEPQSLSS